MHVVRIKIYYPQPSQLQSFDIVEGTYGIRENQMQFSPRAYLKIGFKNKKNTVAQKPKFQHINKSARSLEACQNISLLSSTLTKTQSFGVAVWTSIVVFCCYKIIEIIAITHSPLHRLLNQQLVPQIGGKKEKKTKKKGRKKK